MTRINLVPPEELCDQHLLAEHRELTRIPNAVAKGKYHLKGQPAEYKLGEGHVRFFFNKLAFLKKRAMMHCMRNVRREALTCSIFGMKRYPMIQVYGWTMKPQRRRYRLIGNVFRKECH